MGALSRREEVKAQVILQTKIDKIDQQSIFGNWLGCIFVKCTQRFLANNFWTCKNKLAKLEDAIAISESETINH